MWKCKIAKILRSLLEEQILYSSVLVWAEESATISTNRAEWSMGNGAVGNIGIRIPNGGVAKTLSFHADVYSTGGTVDIALVDFQTGSPQILANIQLSDATDGGGQVNNAHKLIDIDVEIPDDAVLGFRTTQASSQIIDARVSVSVQYEIGKTLKFK